MSTEATLNLVATVAAAIAGTGSAIAAFLANASAKETHRVQLLLQQRQNVIEIWDHMCEVHSIHLDTPGERVRRVVNALELVAICYEANAVDRDLILRTFGETFVATCAELMAHHRRLPDVRNRTGAELLQENKAALLLYDELKARLSGLGKLKG